MAFLDKPLSVKTTDSNRAVAANEEREATMRHPLTIWSDPAYADESLVRLCEEYVEYLKGRSEQATTGERWKNTASRSRASCARSSGTASRGFSGHSRPPALTAG